MSTPTSPRIIGLTGGIGTGKTTVAKLFEKQGVPFLDADQVARKFREPGGLAEPLIQKRFGTTDRTHLRELISKDPKAKKDLEAILHPLIKHFSEKELKYLASKHPSAPFILYEASLLVEAGRTPDFPAILFVTAPLIDRVNRIVTRDQCTQAQAEQMIKAQLTDEQRMARAQAEMKPGTAMVVIENRGDRTELEQKVRKVLEQLKLT